MQLLTESSLIPGYKEKWDRLRCRKDSNFKGISWSDLKALEIVLKNIPEETNLFLSNGTSVRYGQIIPYRPTHATYSNRGVSGIEGCTSTAIGASLVYNRLTCLITGDMSFGYDLGALNTKLADENMRIIVLDNGGGDIFRFIRSTKNLDIREKFLCADMKIPVEDIASAYGWEYFYADSVESLESQIEEFFHVAMLPKLLHIDTRGRNNARILTRYLTSK